jgi:hypothetical protein
MTLATFRGQEEAFMVRTGVVVLFLSSCLLGLLAFGVTAQGPVDDNAFYHIMPDLRTAPAPNWVRPGVRVTYYSAAASIPGGRHAYVEDENGNWVDPGTGKNYRQEDIPGRSGHGYTEINIVGLDQSAAAMDIWSYGIVDAQGRVAIRVALGTVGYPGAGGDWWLSPQVLGRRPNVMTPQLKILRMPYALGGNTFQAIRFQTTDRRGFLAWNYDLETGVLLRTVTSSVGGPTQGPMAQGDSREGQTMITHSTIQAVRTLNIPWASAPAPAWVGQLRVLRYDGKMTATAYPGASPVVFPMSVTFERQYLGTNWARYVQTTSAPGHNPPITRVFGSAQFGGLWVPPAVFGQLQPGQVLDQDRVTGVVTSVGQIGRVLGDIDGVVITMAGSGFRLDQVYDRRNGVLAYSSRVETFFRYEVRLASGQ